MSFVDSVKNIFKKESDPHVVALKNVDHKLRYFAKNLDDLLEGKTWVEHIERRNEKSHPFPTGVNFDALKSDNIMGELSSLKGYQMLTDACLEEGIAFQPFLLKKENNNFEFAANLSVMPNNLNKDASLYDVGSVHRSSNDGFAKSLSQSHLTWG